ncbi:MAG: hypothetical protein N2112_14395 [Gemmataceae bacterium]|jgi:hypothetical protein|nr:hypothetical protein [Gemmataceae bacterium]
MYSLVLMAAVTAAPETPSKFFSCFSCGTGCTTSYSCGFTSHCGFGCFSKFCNTGYHCAPVTTCAPACPPVTTCAPAPTCNTGCNVGCSVSLCNHGCGFSLCGKFSGCNLCGKFWGCGLFSKCCNKGYSGYVVSDCGSTVVAPAEPAKKDAPSKDMPKPADPKPADPKPAK